MQIETGDLSNSNDIEISEIFLRNELDISVQNLTNFRYIFIFCTREVYPYSENKDVVLRQKFNKRGRRRYWQLRKQVTGFCFLEYLLKQNHVED